VAAFSTQVATLPEGAPPDGPLSLPRDFMLDATLTGATPDARAEFVFRRPENATTGGYHLRVDFAAKEVELGGEHKQFRRVCEFDPAQPLRVRLFALGTIVECFINDRYAFTMRAYDYHGPQMRVRAELSGTRPQVAPPSVENAYCTATVVFALDPNRLAKPRSRARRGKFAAVKLAVGLKQVIVLAPVSDRAICPATSGRSTGVIAVPSRFMNAAICSRITDRPGQ